MISDSSLRIVVGANLCGAVARGHHCLSLAGDVVEVFLMLLVIDERAQASQSPFLVLWLVAGLLTLDQDLFTYSSYWVFPNIALTHA